MPVRSLGAPRYIGAIFFLLITSGILGYLALESFYVRICPRVANEQTGHIYLHHLHGGYIYLTLLERCMLYLFLATPVVSGIAIESILLFLSPSGAKPEKAGVPDLKN